MITWAIADQSEYERVSADQFSSDLPSYIAHEKKRPCHGLGARAGRLALCGEQPGHRSTVCPCRGLALVECALSPDRPAGQSRPARTLAGPGRRLAALSDRWHERTTGGPAG